MSNKCWEPGSYSAIFRHALAKNIKDEVKNIWVSVLREKIEKKILFGYFNQILFSILAYQASLHFWDH